MIKIVKPLLFSILTALASARGEGDPRPVSIGAGSYAEFPPSGNSKIEEMLNKPLYIDSTKAGAPVPTNQWWTDLIVRQFCGNLWAHPLTISADADGVKVFHPTSWGRDGRDMVLDSPIQIKGELKQASAASQDDAVANRFAPKDARALNWGDWTIQFRLQQSAAQFMDVTVGHGLPFAWVECQGVIPVIGSGADAKFTDSRGIAVTFPIVADQFCIEQNGRYFGVFAPDNTRFTQSADGIRAAFQGPKSYLIIAALPSAQMLRQFHDRAFAIPRGSTVDWTYNPVLGQVVTTWNLKTEALKGANLDSIQGWIPHHYREGLPQFQFDGIQYQCARGLMKCAEGHQFEIRFPFNGLLPNLPHPQVAGYDEARMKTYIAQSAAKSNYGGDTYWGGKDILCYGRYLAMAEEMGCPEVAALKKTLAAAMADWFTYTPGEKEHYFARYPRWKALVGFRDSYGSGEFNDQHFHYGYFTAATALLGMYDSQFLKDYGPMARLVAKEYANWDRKDQDFPFLRTFDLWEGHSWAGGTSSPGGNNQESSSEAVQSWGGLFLLGSIMTDKDMTAAGAMGYAMETAATREYWFDTHGHMEGPQAAVFPPEYHWKTTGIFFAGGRAYATYFSGDPGWVYGIHWLPASPFMTYLARDPKFSKLQWDNMWADRQAWVDKENAKGRGAAKDNTLAGMGNLATVVLGYQLQFDPDGAAKSMDDLYAAKNPAMTTDNMDGIVYYLAHANRTLGAIQWQCHTSIPTSCVYYNAGTKTIHCVIYNPLPVPQIATVYTSGKAVGKVTVPAKTLLDAPKLQPL